MDILFYMFINLKNYDNEQDEAQEGRVTTTTNNPLPDVSAKNAFFFFDVLPKVEFGEYNNRNHKSDHFSPNGRFSFQ